MVTPVVIWLSVVGAVTVVALVRAICMVNKHRQLKTIEHSNND
jgi:hypothetical protein